MSFHIPLAARAYRFAPREFWPLDVSEDIPPEPNIPYNEPLALTDFPDLAEGRINGMAVIRASSYLRLGFPYPTPAAIPTPSTRPLWTRAVADITCSVVDGLRASLSHSSPTSPPFDSLTSDEVDALKQTREALLLLHRYFTSETDDQAAYDRADLCLNCLTPGDPASSTERAGAIAKACGGDVNIARLSLFNERNREITSELADWKTEVVTNGQAAILNRILGFSVTLDTQIPDGLQDWAIAQAKRLETH
ncbi:hypothetical protein BC826DRAFT_973470, partial [Russula brevipes]